jgi:cation:H+ antiporter
LTITLLLLSGAALLVFGAELLVRGASRIAAAAGISPLIIGLTVVAFGTSAPELAVSVGATFSGEPGIAMGNVVGSNIFNVLFILGVSALIVPLSVQRQVVRYELPIMVGVSVLLLVLALDGMIGRFDGVILVAALAGYLLYLARQGTAPEIVPGDPIGEATRRGGSRLSNILIALVGLALLVAGSRFLVGGAVALATLLGVSEAIIGLTIIAAGTSLPELATSVIAGLRGERDIAVGNVIGSNIFNILAILGLCGLVGPDGVTVDAALLRFDIPVMIAVAVAALPILFTGSRIDRFEGLLFVLCYCAYTAYLILQATQHDALDVFSGALLLFALPLVAIGLLFSAVHARGGPPE